MLQEMRQGDDSRRGAMFDGFDRRSHVSWKNLLGTHLVNAVADSTTEHAGHTPTPDSKIACRTAMQQVVVHRRADREDPTPGVLQSGNSDEHRATAKRLPLKPRRRRHTTVMETRQNAPDHIPGSMHQSGNHERQIAPFRSTRTADDVLMPVPGDTGRRARPCYSIHWNPFHQQRRIA
jgi:hypothetical protein